MRNVRNLVRGLAASGVILASLAAPLAAQDAEEPVEPAPAPDGVLPALSALWFVPESLTLRFPDAPTTADARPVYTRPLPLGAQEAIDRGFALPQPFGVSLIAVNNRQEQSITELEVALGRGEAPPQGTDLVSIPFVELQNVISDTDSAQIKGDLWLLPNLNLFATLGRATGSVDLDVVVDPKDVLPPVACRPPRTCDPVRASFVAGVDTATLSLGATGVYGWGNWFTSGTLSGTASFGENTDTVIRSWTASARFGRRWSFGRGHLAAPYVGISYFDLDQRVEGVTRLPDAFPNGDSLEVRYRADVRNIDKWSGILGLNLGFASGYAISGEVSLSDLSQRYVLSATRRF